MPVGYTTVSGSNLKDATGTVIGHATIYFRPVDNVGNTISFRVGGTGNGQILAEAVSATVTSGAFSIVLADTSLTSPVNVAYAVMVVDNLTGNSVLGSGYLVQPSGDTWNFDTYIPNSAPNAIIQVGPAGPPLTPRGAYASDTTYAEGDVVTEAGSSYISLVSANTGHDPASSPSQWMLNAAAITFDAGGTAQLGSYAHAELPALRNLFDQTRVTSGFIVNNTDGTLFGLGGAYVSDYIPCGGLSTIVSSETSNVLSGIFGYAFYTISKVYISGGRADAGSAITVPAGAAYYRQGINGSNLTTMMVVAGSTLPSTYISFGYDDAATAAAKVATALTTVGVEITAAIYTSESLTQAALPQVRNLFDQTLAQNGWINNTTGAVQNPGAGGQLYTPYIPVLNLTHISESGHTDAYASFLGFAFYDLNKVFISGGQSHASTPISVPTGAAYFRSMMDVGNAAAYMLVPGTTLPTSYMAFGYDDAATTAAKLATALSTSRPLYGKNFGIFGDSLTQACGTFWIPPLLALTGMTNGFNDGHSGRGSGNILENYGPGDGTGVSSGISANGSLTTGTTLAQDLATVDVLFVWVITNDGVLTVGAPTDAPSRTGSFCAVINWYLPILQAAKPKLRIIGVTSYNYMPANGHAGVATAAINLQYVDAMKATYRLNGCHCIDAFELSGLNAENWATYLSDGVHLNAAFGSEKIAPLFAREIQRFF